LDSDARFRKVSDVSAVPIGFVGAPPGGVQAFLEISSPWFFETLGIRLLAGRLTSWSDNTRTRQVAVVSESLARALAPDGDVLNRRVRLGNDREHQDVVIVGVVANATQGNPRRANPPVLYRPALQWTRYDISPTLVIATSGDIPGCGIIPARRAAGVDPVVALRAE
jgi:MacB-like periplasmic core domain